VSQSLEDLVRNQILEEGPDSLWNYGGPRVRDEYIDVILESMPRAEFLQRISDALRLLK
jgi:hypothetical protein